MTGNIERRDTDWQFKIPKKLVWIVGIIVGILFVAIMAIYVDRAFLARESNFPISLPQGLSVEEAKRLTSTLTGEQIKKGYFYKDVEGNWHFSLPAREIPVPGTEMGSPGVENQAPSSEEKPEVFLGPGAKTPEDAVKAYITSMTNWDISTIRYEISSSVRDLIKDHGEAESLESLLQENKENYEDALFVRIFYPNGVVANSFLVKKDGLWHER